jgi:hypothetical protein
MSHEDPSAAERAVMKRHRAENFQERKIVKEAAPLVRDLKSGVNLFTRDEFKAIIDFMVDDKAARKGFIYRGVMKVGAIEIRRNGKP